MLVHIGEYAVLDEQGTSDVIRAHQHRLEELYASFTPTDSKKASPV